MSQLRFFLKAYVSGLSSVKVGNSRPPLGIRTLLPAMPVEHRLSQFPLSHVRARLLLLYVMRSSITSTQWDGTTRLSRPQRISGETFAIARRDFDHMLKLEGQTIVHRSRRILATGDLAATIEH